MEETAKLFYSNSFISINLYSYIAWGKQYQIIFTFYKHLRHINQVDYDILKKEANNFSTKGTVIAITVALLAWMLGFAGCLTLNLIVHDDIFIKYVEIES